MQAADEGVEVRPARRRPHRPHLRRERLQQLDLPVEQIGYGLGFRDPAYFNRFFRKYRGASPGNYRRQIRLEHARSGPSYAAWP